MMARPMNATCSDKCDGASCQRGQVVVLRTQGKRVLESLARLEKFVRLHLEGSVSRPMLENALAETRELLASYGHAPARAAEEKAR